MRERWASGAEHPGRAAPSTHPVKPLSQWSPPGDGTAPRPPFPDFFVIGAQRCGTTTLSWCLKRHPQVCFSKPKETHYFARVPDRILESDRWQADYQRFFLHYRENHRAVGEGSPTYLFASHALERIVRINPRAKLIAIVRNPVEMIRSLHLRLLYILEEDVADLATAWRLQEARARGEWIPRRCSDPRLLRYRELGELGTQIERLYQIAGREQTLVLLFDDLVREPRKVYEQVLGFIGVDDDGRTEFPQQRRSQGYRFRWLQRALYKPPASVVDWIDRSRAERLAKDEDGTARRTSRDARARVKLLHNRLRDWNTRSAAPMDPRTRAMLRDAFASEVAKLSALLDRDLSHWS